MDVPEVPYGVVIERLRQGLQRFQAYIWRVQWTYNNTGTLMAAPFDRPVPANLLFPLFRNVVIFNLALEVSHYCRWSISAGGA